MPRQKLVLYRETAGRIPMLEWLDSLKTKARIKCLVRLARLSELGHEIRRPEADYLRDGVYELRARSAGVHYRMLYFFHGKCAVVVSHGFSKQRARVPFGEIEKALARKATFEEDPVRHTFNPET